ncbi:LysR family transcriptional regulator [Ferrimonas marina]|uniref:Transcriptional regulator, LysR family n=1 Tax=Ferrimonas marina TaxID=299255 RepID=A0A1M5X6S9_9GAMM|nr:LysR family transcriptional regulator [Ferrimonas marina]SHH95540.1 transcriptional regulator, LysR family [Ferrimonas marina]
MYRAPSLPKPVGDYEIKLLRIFLTVVECGGLAAAESTLNLTRSTISIHIKNLEQRLGLVLCVRGRRGFRLTEQGEKTYQAALELMRALDQFSHQVGDMDPTLRGDLILHCSDELALASPLKLPDTIAQLAKQQPQLQLVLQTATIPEIEQAVLSEQAHVGVLPHYRNIDGLVYYPLFSETMYLACGRRHPLFTRTDSEIEDSEVLACGTVHPGVELNEAGRKILRKMHLTARAYHYETRAALVLAGTHLGFFPKSYLEPYLAQGQLRLLQPERFCYPVQHALVCKAGARERQKAALLKGMILEQTS